MLSLRSELESYRQQQLSNTKAEGLYLRSWISATEGVLAKLDRMIEAFEGNREFYRVSDVRVLIDSRDLLERFGAGRIHVLS